MNGPPYNTVRLARTRFNNEPLTPAPVQALLLAEMLDAGDSSARALRADAVASRLWPQRLGLQHRPLRQHTRLYEAPERDQQLAGEGHNAHLAQPCAPRPKALLIPL